VLHALQTQAARLEQPPEKEFFDPFGWILLRRTSGHTLCQFALWRRLVARLVHRLKCSWHMVAFKMGRRQGARRGAYLNRYVTDEQRSRWPIFKATLRVAASWLFFRVARSTVMIQISALRSRLEKQPTDLWPYASYIRDDTLVLDVSC
jgi:hypothetical protein